MIDVTITLLVKPSDELLEALNRLAGVWPTPRPTPRPDPMVVGEPTPPRRFPLGPIQAAAQAEPKPKPAPQRRRQYSPAWATPERREVAENLYRTNVPIDAIRAALGELQGAPVPQASTLRSFIIQVMGVTREPKPPAPTPNTEQRGTPGTWLPPIALPWAEIRQLAHAAAFELRGVRDLGGYNRSRVAHGLAPLAVQGRASH